MHKPLLRAAVMGAFGLGTILALQQPTRCFRDAPAGHWTKEAAALILQAGGTCSGQAATPQDRATAQKEEVGRELAALRTQVTTAQDARLQEEQIGKAQPAAPAATTAEQAASQPSRLEALEGQVDNTLPSTAATPPAPEPLPTALPRLYFGLGAAYPIEPPVAGPAERALAISAFIGSHDVIFGFGPRVGVDYSLGSGSVNVTAYLVRNFNRGAFFDPYLGLGLRYNTASAAALPLYGDAVLGAGFNFSRNFGLLLEGNPGFGDDLSFRFGVRAGLKVAF